MTAEAITYHDADSVLITVPTGGYSSGQVLLLADGRAGVIESLNSLAAADKASVKVRGLVTVAKTASIVILDGGLVKWDHSANSATIPTLVDSKDFILGRAVGDAASAATTMVVDLNASKESAYISLAKSAFVSAPIETAGFVRAAMVGGSFKAAFSATAEAQKIDLLSAQSFALGTNWIFEAVFTVVTTADADVGDLNIGVANATHATDCDSITESCFVHCDLGADLNIDAESDDGTTEVNATDTTIDLVAGTPVHIVFDGRTETDIQLYVNGVNRLAASVFTFAAATGPLKALFHLEKTANDTLCDVLLSLMEVRLTADVEA